MPTPADPLDYLPIHDAAVAQNLDGYIDPQSGFWVFTALYHQKRGTCCLSACRHCPFGYAPPTQADR